MSTSQSNQASASPKSASGSSRSNMKAISVEAKTPPNNCFRGIVTVAIGPLKQAFSIHKGLLCYYSDYFRGAFEGSFKEAVDGKIWLEKEDPAIFDIFNAFLYNRKLQNPDGLAGPGLSFGTLIDLWIFGDRFIVPLLQNFAIDSLRQKSDTKNSIPWKTQIRKIYDNTLQGAPLRKIMIDMMAYESCAGEKSRKEFVESWPVEALVDLAFTLSLKNAQEIGHIDLPEHKKSQVLLPHPQRRRAVSLTGLI